MKLHTVVTKKITDIPQKDWEKVFPKVLESYGFFKSLDESRFEQFSFYYIIVYNANEPVGAAPCFTMRYSLDTSMNGITRKIFNKVKKLTPNMLSLKVVVCGMPIGKGFIGMAEEKKEIMAAILRKMERIARHERAGILAFKDFAHDYRECLDPLIGKGFTKVDALPYAELDLEFKSFDDYMKILSGASRYDLRRKFKKVASEVKIDTEVVDSLEGKTLDEAYALYTQMLDKHEMGFEVVPKEFFHNVPKNMPGQVKFFLWRIEGKLVAFLFALISDGVMIDYYLGLDYAVAHKYHLFFIKHRDAMSWAINNRIKKYEMGISGYEPKKRLGFDFTPLNIYVKHRNRFMNPFFKVLCSLLKFENFDAELKAVKKEMAKRSSGDKRKSDTKSVHPHSHKRPDGLVRPAIHETGAVRDRD